jgi:rhodanese-related sulfurtransferase
LDKIEDLEKGKSYLVYCRSGRRSIRVCTWMRNGGFDNQKIFNLDKGLGDLLEQFPDIITYP